MEIDEYIRTPKGKLGKVIRIWKCKDRKRYLIDWGNGKATYISQIKNIKHSKNITDLLKKGDYANGYELDEFEEVEGNVYLGIPIFDDALMNCITEVRPLDTIDIATIVTHEQFKEMEYRL